MDFCAGITRLPLPLDGDRAAAARARASGPLADLLAGAAGSSPYLAGLIEREGEWLVQSLDVADVVAAETAGFETLDAPELGPALRQAKRRVALLAALADLGGVWPLERVTATLTALADRAVDLAFRAHLAIEVRRGRLPQTDAEAGGLILLAMGKMGAGELNYSSDIDLICLYDDEAYAAADRQEARATLIKVTRRAAAMLSDLTDQGYVFRTDLRLRPDAAVTPVCISASAALAYYEAEGRTWERAAYIKARPCGGDRAAAERFLQELRPFVWRRHLDFAAIEDAHAMRLRIRDHKGLHGAIAAAGHDMKLGQGGIREIEFFTQTRQLIAGGRDPSLRVRGTVEGLEALAAAGWIPQAVATELTDHYRHHREIEHRVQMVNDAQTHALPAGGPALDAVARLCGVADTEAFCEGVRQRLVRVEALTEAFFDPGERKPLPSLTPEAQAIIRRWRSYPALRSARATRVFLRLEPELLTRLLRAAHPEEALARFDSVLAGLPAGVQLFSLFEANPHLIDLVADICATSPALAAYFARHPGVLDVVIAGSFFAPWPGGAGLVQQVADAVQAGLAAGGYERALDAARRVAHDWQFRVGVHHLRGLIDGEEAAVQYADLADAVLRALIGVVTDEVARRHGPPPGRGAVVLGMGSLGARRLNAASDLDLLVIYDAAGAEASEGAKPLAPRAWYARLTQALVTALSAPTAEGRLYEVDMRLRPSGRQGPVATALHSFRDYQMTEAWTWEHLALTRARPVAWCGSDGAAMAEEVEELRRAVLAACGNAARVLPDLGAMRMRIAAAKGPEGPLEARQGTGRLQDIELFAQSLALRAGDPARGTAAQLRAGRRAGLITPDEAESLASAQRFLWQVHAAGRLLSEGAATPEGLGQGARDFLLREAGAETVEALSGRMAAIARISAAIIEAGIGGQDAGDAATGWSSPA